MKKLYKLLLTVSIGLGSITTHAGPMEDAKKAVLLATRFAEASTLNRFHSKDVHDKTTTQLRDKARSMGYYDAKAKGKGLFPGNFTVMHFYDKGGTFYIYFQYKSPITGEIIEAGVPTLPGLHRDKDIQAKKHLFDPLLLEDKILSMADNITIRQAMKTMFPPSYLRT